MDTIIFTLIFIMNQFKNMTYENLLFCCKYNYNNIFAVNISLYVLIVITFLIVMYLLFFVRHSNLELFMIALMFYITNDMVIIGNHHNAINYYQTMIIIYTVFISMLVWMLFK